MAAGIAEVDRVLGGGLAAGSVVLSAASQVGKSTLLAQICQGLALGGSVLYVSAESASQVRTLPATRRGSRQRQAGPHR